MFFVSATVLMLYAAFVTAVSAESKLLPFIAFLLFLWTAQRLQKYCHFQYVHAFTGGPSSARKIKYRVRHSQLSYIQRMEIYKSFGTGSALYALWAALVLI